LAEKSVYAEQLGAAGIVFVNTEEGNMHPPAPDVRDLKIAPTMLNALEGEFLISALSKAVSLDITLSAQFIPVACVEEPKNLQTASFCEPVMKAEREFALNQVYGGYVITDGGKFDYAQVSAVSGTIQFAPPPPPTHLQNILIFPSHICPDTGRIRFFRS